MTKYTDVLCTFKGEHFCPFCNESPINILEERKYFYVVAARSPYVEDHILIVPKRHVCLLKSLKHKELLQMHSLIDKRDKKLHKYHKNISLLLRDGLSKKKIGKSINHLHFHLIPDHSVFVVSDEECSNRNFYNDEEYSAISQNIRTKYSGKNI